MATNYILQANEVVLIKDESVSRGGYISAYTDTLMLTNLNLVLLQKGILGLGKSTRTFPLNQIKVHNQQAQALAGKAQNGSNQLEVYFLNGQENFQFQSGGKKKIINWIDMINLAVLGEQAAERQRTDKAIPGAEAVADALKDTFSVFKSKLGSKPNSTVKITEKCRGCGAPVVGFQGQLATCEYCGSTQQLRTPDRRNR